MRKNLIEENKWGDTLIMSYSEFGRRLKENGSRGTDHGTASVHMVLGGSVNGGIYGEYPSLKELDKNEDLVYTSDFKDLYQSILHKWLDKSQKTDYIKL